MKNIYIFGANGQDGNLTKLKIRSLYSNCNFFLFSKDNLSCEKNNKITNFSIKSQNQYLNITTEIMNKSCPDLIFYFAAVHYSSFESEIPGQDSEMVFTNYFLPIHILRNCNLFEKKPSFIYTSSSLIFAGSDINPQNEKTQRMPICNYSRNKTFAEEIIIKLGKAMDIKIYIAILYNHESIFRKDKFFSKKVIKFCANSKRENNKQMGESLILYNPQTIIDMGYAPEYVDIMIKLILSNMPGVYIISTGTKITVKNFVDKVLKYYGIEENKIIYKSAKPRYENILVGDNSKLTNLIKSKVVFFGEKLINQLCKDFDDYTSSMKNSRV